MGNVVIQKTRTKPVEIEYVKYSNLVRTCNRFRTGSPGSRTSRWRCVSRAAR